MADPRLDSKELRHTKKKSQRKKGLDFGCYFK